VYIDILSEAAIRIGVTFFFMVKGCLRTARMMIIERNVKKKRRNVRVVGEP
jgi:hypothetical protein